ncbi:hypothetical protein SAMN05518670_5431 [Paenibacillus sp. OK076]|nr:hypothetical protein SAMN05518670_5431 [Paenibacillus sp. OK076]
MSCVIGDGHKPVPLGTGFFYTVNRRKPLSELLLDKELGAIGEAVIWIFFPRLSVLLELYVPILCGMIALPFSMLWMVWTRAQAFQSRQSPMRRRQER